MEDLLAVPIKVLAGGRLGPFREEYDHPQLANTCRAKICCPTRAAAKRIRSVSGSDHTLVPALRLIWSQACFKHGYVQFLLAEQGKLAAVLQAQEVRQPARADALGAGGVLLPQIAAKLAT